MTLLHFAQMRMNRQRCRHCSARFSLSEYRIEMAGFSRARLKPGTVFEVHVRCRLCRHMTTVSFPQPFDRKAIVAWVMSVAATVETLRDGEDEPQGDIMRVVNLMDCAPGAAEAVNVMDCGPGRADARDTGEPVALVTLEHAGEIDMPMMLRMRDTKRLAVGLLAVLAHHGDETALSALQQHFSDHLCD